MQSFLFHLPSWTILIHSTDEKFFTFLLAFLPHFFGVGKGTWKLKCWLHCDESNYSFRPVINLELMNLHYHRAESKFSLLKGEDLGWRVVRWAEAAFLLFVLLLFVLCWVRVVKETLKEASLCSLLLYVLGKIHLHPPGRVFFTFSRWHLYIQLINILSLQTTVLKYLSEDILCFRVLHKNCHIL